MIRLVAITDSAHGGTATLIDLALAAERGGATCIQLRLKEATPRELVDIAKQLVSALGIPLIVNDRADIAIAAGAAGCHLGPEDVPVSAIRKIVPPGFIIGCSVGNDDEIPNSLGADYAGLGPVFGTPSKLDAGKAIGLDGFRELALNLKIPAVGIGGITAANARSVIDAGAVGVAAIGAIFGAADVERASSAIARAIGN